MGNARTALRSIGSSLLLALLGVGATSTAAAQCYPGQVCAQVVVTTPPPPQVIVVQPVAPPPAQVVVVQPAPPPPQYVWVPAPPPVPAVRSRPTYYAPRLYYSPTGLFGVRFAAVGAFGANDTYGGGGVGSVRFVGNDIVAVDLNLGGFYGVDELRRRRGEVLTSANALFFVNPRDTARFYMLAGIGFTWSFLLDNGTATSTLRDPFIHLGGEIGAGVELRLNQAFALAFDIRGYLRGHIGGRAGPEFVDVNGRRTGLSGGITTNLAAIFYF